MTRATQIWKDKYTKLQAEMMDYRRKVRNELTAKYKKRMTKAFFNTRNKASELADKRIDRRKLNRTSYFDGIFSYMTIVAFAYGKELSPTGMAYLTLLNLVPKMTIADCKKFGFGRAQEIRVYLERLVDYGYAERFEVGANVVYSVSMKGKKTFNAFREHHRKTIRNLKENDEYKRTQREWSDENGSGTVS
jgi:hypothetical protein